MDCGPTCLQMVAKHYGRYFRLPYLRKNSFITHEGVSLLGISDAAEAIGFRTIGIKTSFKNLIEEAPLPCIVHWYQRHFIVVYKITSKSVYVADPSIGLIDYSHEDFMKGWCSVKNNGKELGIALLLEPTSKFYEPDEEDSGKTNQTLISYGVI
ncbi:MAG: cysteine peptidase family C39 domain-containing protein [Cyclobacteriaceae bacterium]